MRLLPGDGELVVKPSVSAGSRDTARYSTSETVAARHHAERLLAKGRTVLVQPYQDSVDSRGETFARAELLYARVDLLEGPDGTPLLLELELVEPSMFLSYAPPPRVAHFAAAIMAVANDPGRP